MKRQKVTKKGPGHNANIHPIFIKETLSPLPTSNRGSERKRRVRDRIGRTRRQRELERV